MSPRVGVCGSQASTATYFVPSVSYAIRGHRSSVISDAAEDDRLMREIVKDLRKPPTLPSVSPEPHAPGRAAPRSVIDALVEKQVHRAARRRGGLAAGGASAASRTAAAHWRADGGCRRSGRTGPSGSA